jgi:hypothetical protein
MTTARPSFVTNRLDSLQLTAFSALASRFSLAACSYREIMNRQFG